MQPGGVQQQWLQGAYVQKLEEELASFTLTSANKNMKRLNANINVVS